MKEIGLFLGSFNPIHNGHLMLAQYMANFGGVDEVWFIVSPQNPFKQDSTLAPAHDRVEMVRRATEATPYLRVCDIELSLPVPSYTINTLRALEARHSNNNFTIIMGGDNVSGLPRWFEAEEILRHRIIVYPRPGYNIERNIKENELLSKSDISITEAPQIDISSTMLREWIAKGKSIEHFVNHYVAEYIEEKGLYLPA